MKKTLTLLLALLMCLSLVLTSCNNGLSDEDMDKIFGYIDDKLDGKDDGNDNNDDNSNNQTSTHTHSYSSWTVSKEATCVDAGEESRACSCGDVEKRTVAATGVHTYGSNSRCSGCGSPKPSEGLAFKSNGDGTCSVVGKGTCTDTKLVIPMYSPAGDIVTSIGEKAFCASYDSDTEDKEFAEALTVIILPDSIKHIGEMAFYGCGMTNLTIPSGVTSMETLAFAWCEKLSNLVISDGVSSIGQSAFTGCSNLKNITIPGSVKEIGAGAFSSCANLSNVVINDGVKIIGKVAFSGCEKLTTVTIPNSVNEIGNGAFAFCKQLTTIYFNGTSAQWNSISKIDNGGWDDWDYNNGNNYKIQFSDGSSGGWTDCSHCTGGMVTCTRCGGNGWVYDAWNNKIMCGGGCGGSGAKYCPYCDGNGQVKE